MKNLLKSASAALFVLGLSTHFLVETHARDLTYKGGFGYTQVFSNSVVPKGTNQGVPRQINGLMGSYGIANDLQLGAFLGFEKNFDHFMVGPFVRYDIHRLLNRELMLWNHLNIFIQTAFLLRAGGEVEVGLTFQAPYVGFEIFPFTNNFFSIQTAAGVVVDLMKDSAFGFTNAMFGDVGVKYYF
jgi:hypothetical protein